MIVVVGTTTEGLIAGTCQCYDKCTMLYPADGSSLLTLIASILVRAYYLQYPSIK